MQGYNHGGRILGNATEGGKECATARIRSDTAASLPEVLPD